MLYNFLKIFLRVLLLPLVKVNIKNKDYYPVRGPLILVCNHTSLWDPVILGVFFSRKLHFMAKEELFDIFLLGNVIRKLGTFPVKRGSADRNAIRQSLKILKDGNVLCIFPEGTRSKSGKLLKFQPGATMLALKGKAPIIPIGLKGTKNILSKGLRTKIELNIGEPLYIENMYKGKISNEQLDEITKILENKVKVLLK